MRYWTPPKGTEVKIILRPRQPEKRRGVFAPVLEWALTRTPVGIRRKADAKRQAAFDLARAEIARLAAEFKAPKLGDAGLRLSLTDKRWPGLLDALETAFAERNVEVWICDVNESPPTEESPNAWFDVANVDFAPPFKRASAMRPDVHVAQRDMTHVVSEKFIEAVNHHGLTGLEHLPLKHDPRPAPLAWFQVFASHPIGRGLDHPLLDRAAFERTSRELAAAPWLCDGWTQVWDSSRVKQGVEIGDEGLARLQHIVGNRFRIFGQPRFVREHLPHTDFAYWWSSATHQDCRPGRGRIRSLCCNARARAALIADGVANPKAFRAMAVVAARDADAEILDRRPLPLPPPTFTPEEAAAERARREAIKLSAPAARDSLGFASWLEAEQYLTTRLKDGSATWTPMSAKRANDALADPAARACPKAWRMLLPLIPEWLNDSEPEGLEFECGTPRESDWQAQDKAPNDEKDEDGPLEGDIVIAWSPNGDWFAIRPTDPAMPEEASVTWWSHETLLAHQEWPTICAFVAELIETADRDAEASDD